MDMLFNPNFQRKADEFTKYSIDLHNKIMSHNFNTDQLIEMSVEHKKRVEEMESAYKQTVGELINVYESGAYDEK